MMPLHWLLRMRRWIDNPPSLRKVILIASVVGLCLGLAAWEWLFGWPEALTLSRTPRSFR